jgi:hypothetical protein
VDRWDLISAMNGDLVRPLDIRTPEEKKTDVDHAQAAAFALRERHEEYAESDTAYVGDATHPEDCAAVVRQQFTKILEIRDAGARPWVGSRLVNTGDVSMPGHLNPSRRESLLPVVRSRETVLLPVGFTALWSSGTFISRRKLLGHDGLMVFPDKIGQWLQVDVEDV